MTSPPGRLIVVSSPSGGGKTTVVQGLRRRMPRLRRSVSVTTRARRPGERDGRDYHFISAAEFSRLRRARQLLEWARVHGAAYGTPRGPIERALARGHDVILSIDVQGARKIRRAFGRRALLVFLLPPAVAVLRQRLLRRRTETPASLARRLAAAARETACANWYDVRLANGQIATVVDRLAAVLRRDRSKRGVSHGSRTD